MAGRLMTYLRKQPADERGVALITVLLINTIFILLVGVLLLLGQLDRVIAVN